MNLSVLLTTTILFQISFAYPQPSDFVFPDNVRKTSTDRIPVSSTTEITIPTTSTEINLDVIPEIETKLGDVNMLKTVDEEGNYIIPIDEWNPPKETMEEAEGAYFRPLFVYRQQQAKRRNHNNHNNNNNRRSHNYDTQNRFSHQNYNNPYNTNWRRSGIYKRSPNLNGLQRPVQYYRTKFNRFLPKYRFRS